MEPIPSSGPLAFLLELDRMKEIWRKNPVHGTTRMENDAEEKIPLVDILDILYIQNIERSCPT